MKATGIDPEGAAWPALFEEAVSDKEFQDGKSEFAAFEIASKEELFYLRALARSMDVGRVSHPRSPHAALLRRMGHRPCRTR